MLGLSLGGCGPRIPALWAPAPTTHALSRDQLSALHGPVVRGAWDPDLSRTALHALLSTAFADDALTEAYVAHHEARERLRLGDVQLTVDDVEYAVPDPRPDGRIDAAWTVTATLHHEQHVHPRRHRFDAVLTVRDDQDGPRIVALDPGRVAELPAEVGQPTDRQDVDEQSILELLEIQDGR